MKKFQVREICMALGACGLLTAASVGAAPMTLAQSPAGSVTVTPPPPNLILTLDNSTSMDTKDSGQTKTRFESLRSALKTAFSAENVPQNSIRLGWNTLNNFRATTNRNKYNSYTGPTYACSSFNSTGNSCGTQGNIVRPLTNEHRTNFINWIDNVFNMSGSTPTHNAYQRALAQYDISYTNSNSPWAEVPGSRRGDYLTCRKSYVMLLTDGEYNGGQTIGGVQCGSNCGSNSASFDLDNVNRTLGDGTAYNVNQSYAKIYKQTTVPGQGNFSGPQNYYNSLADLAFHYWAKDIDGISTNNNVKPLEQVTTDENNVIPFWNPKNNPATWQHVSTYTIGYGKTASGWNTRPRVAAGETLHGSADLKELMLGNLTWPTQSQNGKAYDAGSENGWNNNQLKYMEMMHAAINGRGKFYPASSEAELVAAIKDLLTDVIPVAEQQVTSATGSSLSAAVESSAFFTSYDSKQWSGNLKAVTLKPGGGVDSSKSPWSKSAAELLDDKVGSSGTSHTARKILTTQISLSGSPSWTGKTFEWGNLSTDQQTALRGTATSNSTSNALGTARLNYLRGLRTGEGTTYRERASVLGDIVNSKVWFMKGVPNAGYTSTDYLAFVKARKEANRTSALFVGANDGMLHAFDADDGQELFAYVPLGAYANLASLTAAPYAHKYFVDGSPFTADYCKGSYTTGNVCSSWGTMLVGFMGAGGKGYFMIDVTDPAAVDAASVRMDTTSGYLPGRVQADPDIGHITQQPVLEQTNPLATRQIARMNNGKWALVTGNGYNSTNEKAVLIIQYLDGSAPKKIYAGSTATSGEGQGNGLSAPRLIDLNGDSIPDMAYAGDLKGNLWKFDLAGTSDGDWKLASSTPMFQAVSASGAVQPITTAPIYQVHPTKGLMVVFGTGQNLTVADRSDITVQSFYGLYDFGFKLIAPNAYKMGGVKVEAPANMQQIAWGLPWKRENDMLQQTVNTDSMTTTSSLNVATKGMDAMGTDYRGWYIDLPLARERVLRNPQWFDGDLVDLLSDVPAVAATSTDPCEAVETSAASHYITVLNGVTGNAPAIGSAGGWANPADPTNPANREKDDVPNVRTDTNEDGISTCVGDDCESNEGKPRSLLSRYFKAPSWRQMQ